VVGALGLTVIRPLLEAEDRKEVVFEDVLLLRRELPVWGIPLVITVDEGFC
jgi:hypothetical protein